MSSRVSTTTGEEIADAFLLDYAPTGRAACKKCGSNIGEGQVRVSKKVRSRFHDGFDFQLLHWRCGQDLASSLEGFIGWQRLRWADIEKLVSAKGEEFSADSQLIENLRKRNGWLSDATDHLAGAPVALLKATLDANAVVYSDKAKGVELAGIIAEQMLFGKLPTCPTCNTHALRQDGTDYRCHGWFSASTKCAFRFRTVNLISGGPRIFGGLPVGDEGMIATVSRRGILSIPDDALNHKIFKTIKIPREIIAEQKKRKIAPTNSTGISTSACELLDSEPETDSPPTMWLAGLRVCFLGCARKQELSAKIIEFGGEVQDELEVAGKSRTTHLVVGEDELDRDPKAQRYRAAVDAGVPIVFDAFIDSFTEISRSPEVVAKVSVSGRSKDKKNSQINGDYENTGNFFSDRPVFVKSGKTELFLFFCAEKCKWKINPKVASDAGQVASNSDAAVLPHLCGKSWTIFDGKEDGFNEDRNVIVSSTSGPTLASGVALRQRKILRKFLVDSGLGRKLPRIAEVVKQREAEKNRGKKRAAPIKGSPILTVDDECDLHDCEIFIDHNQNAFNAYLTRTDAVNNVNKFYAIQLLVSGSARDKFSVFRKWGRVGGGIGKVNDLLLVKHRQDKRAAIDEFEKKFEELTGWKWSEREGAEQKPGRYAQVELSGQDEGVKAKKKKKTADDVPCTLPTPVKALIETIFDSEMVEHTMRKQLDIDTAQLPLHALSKRQIEQGLSVLKEIATILLTRESSKENVNKSSNITASQLAVLKLKDASSRYFTLIPHTFGAKQSVPVIEDVRTVKKETRAMEDLLSIVDYNTVRSAADHLSGKHIYDLQYEKLGCSISPVDSSSREWDWICRYVRQTHAPTHNDFSLQVVHILDVHRSDEVRAFDAHHVRHNRQMLWHGSRITNWVSILSKGLRIAPKEAPVTGYMFGKGIYFSDVCSKSANYCKATSDSPHGVLALCDVALGDCYVKLEAEYAAIDSCKSANLHSTFAVGQTAPSYVEEVAEGVHAPLGTLEKNEKLLSEARSLRPNEKPSLLYNEYVVYDTSQVRIKYLVFVKFAFESGSLLD